MYFCDYIILHSKRNLLERDDSEDIKSLKAESFHRLAGKVAETRRVRETECDSVEWICLQEWKGNGWRMARADASIKSHRENYLSVYPRESALPTNQMTLEINCFP